MMPRATALRRLEQLRAIAETVTALEAAGVSVMLLKGEATFSRLYEPTEARPTADIDLLVRASQRPRADEVLAARGWRLKIAGVLPAEGGAHSRDWVRGDGPTAVALDLHTTFHAVTASPETVFDLWYCQAEALQLGAVTVVAPSAATTALILAVHRTRAPGERAAEDLQRALRTFSHDVWRAAAEQARLLGCAEAMAAGLHSVDEGARVSSLLDLPAPGWRELAQHRRVTPVAAGLLRVGDVPGVRAKASFVWREVACSRGFLELQHPYAARGGAWVAAARVHRVATLSVRVPRAVLVLVALRFRSRPQSPGLERPVV